MFSDRVRSWRSARSVNIGASIWAWLSPTTRTCGPSPCTTVQRVHVVGGARVRAADIGLDRRPVGAGRHRHRARALHARGGVQPDQPGPAVPVQDGGHEGDRDERADADAHHQHPPAEAAQQRGGADRHLQHLVGQRRERGGDGDRQRPPRRRGGARAARPGRRSPASARGRCRRRSCRGRPAAGRESTLPTSPRSAACISPTMTSPDATVASSPRTEGDQRPGRWRRRAGRRSPVPATSGPPRAPSRGSRPRSARASRAPASSWYSRASVP